jgi:hypothetical protein
MTIHEQQTHADIVRSQTALLVDALALVCNHPATDLPASLVAEIVRLSKTIPPK